MCLDGGLEIEAELMLRLSKHDPQALTAIYDRYARLVYSLFIRITHDRSAAEDLVQELFLRLYGTALKALIRRREHLESGCSQWQEIWRSIMYVLARRNLQQGCSVMRKSSN